LNNRAGNPGVAADNQGIITGNYTLKFLWIKVGLKLYTGVLLKKLYSL